MCYHLTRFSQDELLVLYHHFFGRMVDPTYIFCGIKFSYEETLLIALDYMSNGTKFITMAQSYGGDWSRYSYMVNFFAKFLHHKYYHRLCGRSLSYWLTNDDVSTFRLAIFNYIKYSGTNVIPGLEYILFELFRTFGFLDCMQLAMSRPGSGPINENDERNPENWHIQRAFFTKYGKMWGMKCQGTFFPNGILGNCFFTLVAQNDKGVINISGLEEELERLLMPHVLENGTLPVLYADDIYDPSTVITKANGVNNLFHTRLNGARVDLEHEFGLTASLFKRLRVKHTWKLMNMNGSVNEHLFSIFFMVNVYTCIRGNKTSAKYGLEPPSIEEYLNVTMNDAYDGHDADEMMIERLQGQI